MKLTLPRDALISALDRAGKVVERRNSIPILGNVLVRATGASLALTGTDLDMMVTTHVPADVSEDGETTLPAHTLGDFVRKLPTGVMVSLETAAEGRLTLRAGRSRVTLPTLDPADFPEMAGGDLPTHFSLPASALAGLMDRVAFAISNEETRYYLNGIHFHIAEGEDGPMLRAVATDGHRLGLAELAAPEGAGTLPAIILPRKAVTEIARLLKPLGEEKVGLAVGPTKLQMSAGATILTTKLIDGTFPDYLRVIPTGNDKVATLDSAALAAAVERVTTVSSERARAVKFSFEAGQLRLLVTAPDMGDAADEMDVDYAAAPLTIGFNGAYVADILKAVPGDRALFALNGTGDPCLITAEGDTSCRFVLMPMRV